MLWNVALRLTPAAATAPAEASYAVLDHGHDSFPDNHRTILGDKKTEILLVVGLS